MRLVMSLPPTYPAAELFGRTIMTVLLFVSDSGANPLLSGSAPAVLHILLDRIDLCQSF